MEHQLAALGMGLSSMLSDLLIALVLMLPLTLLLIARQWSLLAMLFWLLPVALLWDGWTRRWYSGRVPLVASLFNWINRPIAVKFANGYSLDDEKATCICLHPHGWFPLFFLMNCCSRVDLADAIWVGERSGLFFPFIGWLYLLWGLFIPAKRKAIEQALEQQSTLVMMPGGVDEMVACQQSAGQICLSRRRQGFLETCYRKQAGVIPGFCTGLEESCYPTGVELIRYVWRKTKLLLPPLLFNSQAGVPFSVSSPVERCLWLGKRIEPIDFPDLPAFCSAYYSALAELAEQAQAALPKQHRKQVVLLDDQPADPAPRKKRPSTSLLRWDLLLSSFFVAFFLLGQHSGYGAVTLPAHWRVDASTWSVEGKAWSWAQGRWIERGTLLNCHVAAAVYWTVTAMWQIGHPPSRGYRHRLMGVTAVLSLLITQLTGLEMLLANQREEVEWMGWPASLVHQSVNIFVGSSSLSFALCGTITAISGSDGHARWMHRSFDMLSRAVIGRGLASLLRGGWLGLPAPTALVMAYSLSVSSTFFAAFMSEDSRRLVAAYGLLLTGAVASAASMHLATASHLPVMLLSCLAPLLVAYWLAAGGSVAGKLTTS